MRRHSAQLTHDPAVLPWLGANFWSRTGGPLMWRSYDAEVVREELRVLRDHGLTMTRSLLLLARLHARRPTGSTRTCARASPTSSTGTDALGMTTVPTFIVGHMSGENWDPSWRGGRDLYGDVWLVARQAWFVRRDRAPLRRAPGRRRLAGLQRDADLRARAGHRRPARSREIVAAWAQLIVRRRARRRAAPSRSRSATAPGVSR